MGREEEIIKERLKKLKELEKRKINPYPDNFDKKNSAEECLRAKLGSKVKIKGRDRRYTIGFSGRKNF